MEFYKVIVSSMLVQAMFSGSLNVFDKLEARKFEHGIFKKSYIEHGIASAIDKLQSCFFELESLLQDLDHPIPLESQEKIGHLFSRVETKEEKLARIQSVLDEINALKNFGIYDQFIQIGARNCALAKERIKESQDPINCISDALGKDVVENILKPQLSMHNEPEPMSDEDIQQMIAQGRQIICDMIEEKQHIIDKATRKIEQG